MCNLLKKVTLYITENVFIVCSMIMLVILSVITYQYGFDAQFISSWLQLLVGVSILAWGLLASSDKKLEGSILWLYTRLLIISLPIVVMMIITGTLLTFSQTELSDLLLEGKPISIQRYFIINSYFFTMSALYLSRLLKDISHYFKKIDELAKSRYEERKQKAELRKNQCNNQLNQLKISFYKKIPYFFRKNRQTNQANSFVKNQEQIKIDRESPTLSITEQNLQDLALAPIRKTKKRKRRKS